MYKKIVVLSIAFFASTAIANDNDSEKILSDEQSAIKRAESILLRTYGHKVLKQRPFKAKLENNIWKVSGTFYCPTDRICKGGVAEVELNKEDGTLIRLSHGK